MKNPEIPAYLTYLKSCYVADNRQLRLSNFLVNSRVEHRLFFDGEEELINDASPKMAIPREHALALKKTVRLYQKEKQLFYASLFLLGSDKVLGRNRKVCAPVLLFPAQIKEEKGYHFLYINQSEWQFNTAVIDLLSKHDSSSAAEEQVLKHFPQFPFDFGKVGDIGRVLQKFFPDLDCESLLFFPELWSEQKLKRQLEPRQRESIDYFKLVPASGIGVVVKSSDTYGILSDLSELEKARSYSGPIKAVFGKDVKSFAPNDSLPGLPTVLNASQERAVLNARSEVLSMIVGPPGTGKSYTIACIALDHLMRGESVLISSKQDEAVDVVARKIEDLLGTDEVLVRGGARKNLTKMRRQLRKLLNLRTKTNTSKDNIASSFFGNTLRLAEKEEKFRKRLDQELVWSEQLFGDSFSEKLRAGIIKTFHSWYQPHWQLLQDIEELLGKHLEMSRSLIQVSYNEGVEKVLEHHRKTLSDLYQGLLSAKSSERDSIFNNLHYSALLKAFPIWLCRLSDLYRIMPQRTELFDVVILDEASQCDMATSMAAIQRGKRVVVCGDPNQLRHSSFLSREKMSYLLDKAGLENKDLDWLNFKSTSFLDMVNAQLQSQRQVSFLDEHYRSVPEIIRFSNRHFYSNALRIMSERPIKSEGLGLFEIKVDGERDAQGVNEVEALEILKRIKTIIDEENEVHPSLKSSIGVISPLRNQADFISELLSDSLQIEELEAHRISVGTAYAFQGEERDVMFLSFAVNADSHHSSFVHLNKPDVFNVSVTRAKGRQYVVHSMDAKMLSPDHYLRLFLEDFNSGKKNPGKLEHTHDNFMKEVLSFFDEHNFPYWVYFSIAGVAIDILVPVPHGVKGIDLIGYPGKYQDALTVERFKILMRAGVSVFPMAYSFWRFRQEESEAELLAFLKS